MGVPSEVVSFLKSSSPHKRASSPLTLRIVSGNSHFPFISSCPKRSSRDRPASVLRPASRYTRKAKASHSLRISRYSPGLPRHLFLTARSSGKNTARPPTRSSFELHLRTCARSLGLIPGKLKASVLSGLYASQKPMQDSRSPFV